MMNITENTRVETETELTTAGAAPRDIDSLVDALPHAVRQTLADLELAPRHAAETTIALLPFGRRALLEAVNVTHTHTLDNEGQTPRERVTLTDWGRKVIQACAEQQRIHPDEQEQEMRAQELRVQLSAVPPQAP